MLILKPIQSTYFELDVFYYSHLLSGIRESLRVIVNLIDIQLIHFINDS